MESAQQRLESKLKQNDNGCLEWQRHRNPYGLIKVNGKMMGAHRLAWEIKNGEIPDGLFVLHKCDNPACCNTDHLFLGSQKDNMQDALKKGRMKLPYCPPEKKARGTKNGMWINRHKFTGSNNTNSKLSDDQRNELCDLKQSGVTAKKLAHQFSICEDQVLRIARSRGITGRPLKQTEKQ
jgi:hypothetical protein